MSTQHTLPDETGHFGRFGGRFVPETLMPALDELSKAFKSSRDDAIFQEEMAYLLHRYVGRPTSL